MSHVNATLTPRTRLRLAWLIVEQGGTYAAAATMFMMAFRTRFAGVSRWARSRRAAHVRANGLQALR